ncbi:hypothetical protein [Hymenobacter koreensis]|uniref:XRE family transcriptional regulator n=1 Tax=Hymenobacter koreensis TaxID=1084523 RepID=A0ABP8JKF0_9BACT
MTPQEILRTLEFGDIKQIATLADVSRPTVSRFFNGKKIGASYAVKVSMATATFLKMRRQYQEQADKSLQSLSETLTKA